MPLPVVAIIGRPNVGKSSLFNWLAGRRIAIVDPTAGVTRDRLTTTVEHDGQAFELVDTGGVGIQDVDNLTAEVERQIQLAIDQAQAILFLVDARAGVASLDEEVSSRLRPLNKPILLVANKCDTPELEGLAADFFRLGHGTPLTVSAQQKRGKGELLEAIGSLLPAEREARTNKGAALKLAIVGRRNTGKSTFINCLAESERVIVSEVAGTTRDSVDVCFERDGKAIIAIDTAGVRRKKSIAGDVEFYSLARAERSIRRADVVLHFLDPRPRISKVDKQLTDYILEQHKPAIFVVNKWDLMTGKLATEQFGNYIHKVFPMLDFVPIAFITAKQSKNVQRILNLAQSLHKQAVARVSTGELNRVLKTALEGQPPPMRQNRRAKVFYATQADVNPPTIVLFTNAPFLFDNTYQRYLVKMFRDNLPFTEVPIKLVLRARTREPERVEEAKPATSRRDAKPKRKKKTRDQEPELWKDV